MKTSGLAEPLVWCNRVILTILRNIQEGSKLEFSISFCQNTSREIFLENMTYIFFFFQRANNIGINNHTKKDIFIQSFLEKQ